MRKPSNKTYSKHTPNHAPTNEHSNWCQSSELGSAKRFNSPELPWIQTKWNDSDRSITDRLIVISARELFESSEENLTESSTLCAETLNKQDQDWKRLSPLFLPSLQSANTERQSSRNCTLYVDQPMKIVNLPWTRRESRFFKFPGPWSLRSRSWVKYIDFIQELRSLKSAAMNDIPN